MRLFVGIRLSEDLKAALAEFAQMVRARIPHARTVATESLHLTLKFLGETEEKVVPGIEAALSGIARTCEIFEIRIEGAGHFPPGGRPRVVWAGVEPSHMVFTLHRKIDGSLEDAGFLSDTRFSGHVTVARLPDGAALSCLDEIERQCAGRVWGTMDVNAIELIRSNLKPGGPEYITVKRFLLGGNHGQGQGAVACNRAD